MVTVHRDLVSRLGPGRPEAILLATPYAFQENAADVSARAQRYFADSVGLRVRVTPGTSRDVDPAMAAPMVSGNAEDCAAARLESADWVFAGPGSPSYALAHWRAGPVAAALRERVLAGHGVTVLASAAAVTAGAFALPVYEIYKAGGAPHWLAGLDLLGALGLKVAVIPHYDNAEGGRYDTRHCYLGARRLAVMERELPADAAVLGVDEHTAVLIDLRTEAVADPRPRRRHRTARREQHDPAVRHDPVRGRSAGPQPRRGERKRHSGQEGRSGGGGRLAPRSGKRGVPGPCRCLRSWRTRNWDSG